MILSLLFKDPALFVAWLLAIFYGITVHEFAHAWAAVSQGDDTPRLAGRLTLNPLAHVDLFGLLMLVAERVGKQIVSLPMFYAMNESDVGHTCAAMREVLGRALERG